jgi:hypothetical protein
MTPPDTSEASHEGHQMTPPDTSEASHEGHQMTPPDNAVGLGTIGHRGMTDREG